MVILWVEPMALHTQGKNSTTELHPTVFLMTALEDANAKKKINK